jgi:hypothetical protein
MVNHTAATLIIFLSILVQFINLYLQLFCHLLLLLVPIKDGVGVQNPARLWSRLSCLIRMAYPARNDV